MSQVLSEPQSAGVQRHREMIDRQRSVEPSEQLRRLRAKWEFCSNSVEAILENAQTQPEEIFTKEDVYPNLPLAITQFVSTIFGFTSKELPVETTSLMESLMESASGWSSSPGTQGSFSKSQYAEKVPA